MKRSWLQGNFLCVWSHLSGTYDHLAERVVEPVTGHFNLMATMKVRRELYSNCNTHWGIVSVCIKRQYTGKVVNRHATLQACSCSHMVKGQKRKNRQQMRKISVMTDKHKASALWEKGKSQKLKEGKHSGFEQNSNRGTDNSGSTSSRWMVKEEAGFMEERSAAPIQALSRQIVKSTPRATGDSFYFCSFCWVVARQRGRGVSCSP